MACGADVLEIRVGNYLSLINIFCCCYRSVSWMAYLTKPDFSQGV